jgi:hypothetical protein
MRIATPNPPSLFSFPGTALVTVLFTVAVTGCGGSPATSVDASEAATEASASPTLSGYAVAQSFGWFPLSFTTTPLASRSIGVRDATGKVFTTSTDATGAFQIAGVIAPYDAVVYPDDPNGIPFVYLGLSTTQPRLAGSVVGIPRSANVDVSVQLQDCGTSTCPYSAVYWFPSLGQSSAPAMNAVTAGQVIQSLGSPTWTGPESATADLHVLERDSQNQHFWHGVTTGIALADQQSITLPNLAVAPVPTAGNITVTLATAGVPSSWGSLTELQYDFPNDGGSVSLGSGSGSTLTSGLPDIAGATVTASVLVAPMGTRAETAAWAYSLPLPLSTTAVALTAYPPPTVTAPQVDEELSKTGVIAWSGGAVGQVFAVALTPIVNGDAGPTFEAQEAWVFTSGTSVDLGALDALNVPLAVGSTGMTLWGQGQAASLNAVVDGQTLEKPDGTASSVTDVMFALTE